MNMKKSLLILSFALLSLGVSAQTEVNTYQPGVTLDGVTYYLPRTAIRFVVTVEKAVYTPGEFCKYADRYLRLKNIKQDPSTEWSIKSITMETYGVPDKSKIFNIPLKSKTVAPLVSLTDNGILLAINTEKKQQKLSALPVPTKTNKGLNPRDYMSQEILTAGSNAKIAELSAQEIYDIRESRNALIRGEADNTPKDGAQLKLMLDQLNQQEEALSQLFKGTIETSTEIITLTLDPSEESEKMILFRFSEKLGVVDNDDLAGSPVYISIQSQHTVPTPIFNETTAKKKKKIETGVSYNVPEQIAVKVFDANKSYCQAEFAMAQFGNVEILSDLLFNKKNTTKVRFFETTGGVELLEAEEPK